MNPSQTIILVVVGVVLQAGALLFLASVLNRSNDLADEERSREKLGNLSSYEETYSEILEERREARLADIDLDDDLKDILF